MVYSGYSFACASTHNSQHEFIYMQQGLQLGAQSKPLIRLEYILLRLHKVKRYAFLDACTRQTAIGRQLLKDGFLTRRL